jgi:hypothetical protein
MLLRTVGCFCSSSSIKGGDEQEEMSYSERHILKCCEA